MNRQNFAILCLALILCAATAATLAKERVTNGPWELRVDCRTFSALVFGEVPPPEGTGGERQIGKGSSIKTQAFGMEEQLPEGKFLEVRLVLKNRTTSEEIASLHSQKEFVVVADGEDIQPIGIRALGWPSLETTSGVIREFSGQLDITVAPESEDSQIVVLFDIPATAGKVHFCFQDFPPIEIQVPPAKD